MMKTTSQRANSLQNDHSTTLPTFVDHLRELQGRLFSTVFVFIMVAGAAYPFFDKIAAFIMAPLKEGQELVYLTPGGAFSFIIKVCLYVGLMGSLPIIIFHVYRFIMPAVKKIHMHTALQYTLASMFLAVAGAAFAYYVSLPASLYFLTSFDLNHINPMLTIDSYFSFVMTYLLAGAVLFQLPLLMLIINGVTPLTPKKLMNYQRHMIVGSFIVAAVISPTPDALNQTLLASPMVVMYQIGIITIWLRNRKARVAPRRNSPEVVAALIPPKLSSKHSQATLNTTDLTVRPASPNQAMPKVVLRPVAHNPDVKLIDGFRRQRQQRLEPSQHRHFVVPTRDMPSPQRALSTVTILQSSRNRSVDGIISPTRHLLSRSG